MDLVDKVNKIFKETIPNFTYNTNDELEVKIAKIAKIIYGANGIELSNKVKEKIANLKKLNLDKRLICIAKTSASLSDNPKLLGAPKDWKLNVKDLDISNGAGFIVVKCGPIMTMPGLPMSPQAHKIDLTNGEITGIS